MKSFLASLLVALPTLAFAASPSTVSDGKLSWGTSPTFAPFEFQRDGQAVEIPFAKGVLRAAEVDEEVNVRQVEQGDTVCCERTVA